MGSDGGNESLLPARENSGIETLFVEVGLEVFERQCIIQNVDVASALARDETTLAKSGHG